MNKQANWSKVSYYNKAKKSQADTLYKIRNGDFQGGKFEQTRYLMNKHLDPKDKGTPAAEATEGLHDDQLKKLWLIIRDKKRNVDCG